MVVGRAQEACDLWPGGEGMRTGGEGWADGGGNKCVQYCDPEKSANKYEEANRA